MKIVDKMTLDILTEIPSKRPCTFKKCNNANSPLIQSIDSIQPTENTDKIWQSNVSSKKGLSEVQMNSLNGKNKNKNKKNTTGRRVKRLIY